jgi:hypothetical protein
MASMTIALERLNDSAFPHLAGISGGFLMHLNLKRSGLAKKCWRVVRCLLQFKLLQSIIDRSVYFRFRLNQNSPKDSELCSTHLHMHMASTITIFQVVCDNLLFSLLEHMVCLQQSHGALRVRTSLKRPLSFAKEAHFLY